MEKRAIGSMSIFLTSHANQDRCNFFSLFCKFPARLKWTNFISNGASAVSHRNFEENKNRSISKYVHFSLIIRLRFITCYRYLSQLMHRKVVINTAKCSMMRSYTRRWFGIQRNNSQLVEERKWKCMHACEYDALEIENASVDE